MNLTFPRLKVGKTKNANKRAKPKWIALAGKPLKIQKSNMTGNGDAYQSWKHDQIISITKTIFKWNPVRLFVGKLYSSLFSCILVLTGWFFFTSSHNNKTFPL